MKWTQIFKNLIFNLNIFPDTVQSGTVSKMGAVSPIQTLYVSHLPNRCTIYNKVESRWKIRKDWRADGYCWRQIGNTPIFKTDDGQHLIHKFSFKLRMDQGEFRSSYTTEFQKKAFNTTKVQRRRQCSEQKILQRLCHKCHNNWANRQAFF